MSRHAVPEVRDAARHSALRADALFDARARADLGAFATPEPIVRFMVAAVDEALRSRLGVGVADVRMLDPATGTGPFLVEWLRRGGRAPHAFELMPEAHAAACEAVAMAGGEGATIVRGDALDYGDDSFDVVIGNPPYRRGRSRSRDLEPVLAPLRAAGLGVHAKNAYNEYVYFWLHAIECLADAGVVAFITPSSYLDGPSLAGLRHHLRKTFDELWIVDLGGEGRGAHVEENVFAIRTPVAIAIAVRTPQARTPSDCRVLYKRVRGTRTEKLAAVEALTLDPARFEPVAGTGMAAFTPTATSAWPAITELFPWVHSGVQFKRTWPIAPERATLERRWRALCMSSTPAPLLRETPDRPVAKRPWGLLTESVLPSVAELGETDEPEAIVRYGYRSFDRQWAIADMRVADRPRPSLWRAHSDRQLYLTTLTSTPLGAGPAVTATPYVPDLDHFRGSYGARNVMPLWHADGTPNVAPGLLDTLSARFDVAVGAEQLAAYAYALLGTGAYAERFAAESAGPPHVPLTADAATFAAAVDLGTELLNLHTWHEGTGRARELAPVTDYPRAYAYDAGTLHVGDGRVGPVSQAAWDFEVSGLRVLRSWLGYRVVERRGRRSSPLDDLVPDAWTLSAELLQLIHLVDRTIELTPRAGALLDRIVRGPLLEGLPAAERKPPRQRP